MCVCACMCVCVCKRTKHETMTKQTQRSTNHWWIWQWWTWFHILFSQLLLNENFVKIKRIPPTKKDQRYTYHLFYHLPGENLRLTFERAGREETYKCSASPESPLPWATRDLLHAALTDSRLQTEYAARHCHRHRTAGCPAEAVCAAPTSPCGQQTRTAYLICCQIRKIFNTSIRMKQWIQNVLSFSELTL